MTTRDELAREIQRTAGFDEHDDLTLTRVQADAILDAILPQITTIEELDALPVGTILVSAGGTIITRAAGPLDREKLAIRAAVALLPLTVVWRPS